MLGKFYDMISGFQTMKYRLSRPGPDTSKIVRTGLSGYRTFHAIIYYESGLETFMIIPPHSLGLDRTNVTIVRNRNIRIFDEIP